MSWNVEGLSNEKKNNKDFSDFITGFDLICLYETWTSKNSKIDLIGYSKPIHSYRRFQNKRAKRASGGLLIYIKDSIRKGVKLVKNDIDTIIWVKLEKEFFQTKSDRFIAAVYIPPENSAVNNVYNIDFFRKLEVEISAFSRKGDVYLLGDLNCRTGRSCDYIVNDSLLPGFDNNSTTLDSPTRRHSMDNEINRYGICLLDLCKSTGMRILNGRIFENTDKMTCFTTNGESLIDYALSVERNFGDISDMKVFDFNEFSNHTPISIHLKIGTQRSSISNTIRKTYYKWDDSCTNEFIQSLAKDINLLYSICEEESTIESTVEKFAEFITDRANPFFQKSVKIRKDNVFSSSNFAEKQKWYDKDCYLKKSKVQEAIRDYNIAKTDQNRARVFICKKDYKYFCRKCKQKYNNNRYRTMNEVRKKKPKEFWKMFKERKNTPQNNISENEFFEYFKNLSSETEETTPEDVRVFLENFDSEERETTFNSFDDPFSLNEIRAAISNLSSNKTCGSDNIINEYFKNAADILVEPLQILFNKILHTGIFPSQWATGLVVPIYKKGDADDMNNYRGITLISCFAKLFTSILNNRLKAWQKENDVSTDAQFGFKPNHSTIDAIFILKYLIDKQLNKNRKLYCSFIDMKKAFDSVSRTALWYKLIKCGIDGKILKIIRSLYEKIKLRVKSLNSLSDLFNCDVGLLQGEILSPFLFSIFLNDIEMHLSKNIQDGVTLDHLQLYLLLFADDAVLVSETPDGLQRALDNLHDYCIRWNLNVNTEKTKIVVFRKGGTMGQNDHWYYAGREIEVVNSFNYLGVVFSCGGSFMQHAKYLSDKALKAMHSLLQITKDMEIPVNIMLQLFDSLVASILNYGCETWGFLNAECVERIHRKFLKYILNVKLSTNNYAIYKELGRYPLRLVRYIRIIKYWFKLADASNSNCILNTLYINMLSEMEKTAFTRKQSWLSKVKHLLDNNGFSEVWYYPHMVQIKTFLPELKNRLIDNFIGELRRGLESCSSMSLYREISETLELAPYTIKLHNRKQRNAMAKLRLSSHCLLIETGRHNGITRENRKCTLCSRNDIEDEFHFVLICPLYHELRMIYIKRYFTHTPSMFKFLELLNSSGKTLRNLALYINKAFKMRQETINNIETNI